MPDLIVAGAGMAGLVAAAQARERGAEVELREKLDRPGGSMLLSSGVIWRHHDLASFRRECPGGELALQRLLIERLDSDLAWLRSLGAQPLGDTANERTTGVRFAPAQLTESLVAASGAPRLRDPLTAIDDSVPTILATGGFAADPGLLRRHVTAEADELMLRAAPGATGDGLRLGLAHGARTADGLGEIYGRNMPAPPALVTESEFVSASQLYAHAAEIRNERGELFESEAWSQIDAFQWTARQPRARAWFRVQSERLDEVVGERTIAAMIDAAAAAGAPVRRDADSVTVETVAGITTTLGGLECDARARVASNLFAAGGDVGGIATGGYASGLASALVFGRIAADAALGVA
jgi:succinate dehydrogenase/fumarate reductase flavoprotein subunit